MKKIFILFILTLVSSLILFGCTLYTDEGQNGGYINEDGETIGGSGNGEHITEDETIDDGENIGGSDNGEQTVGGETSEGDEENTDDCPDENDEIPDESPDNIPDEPQVPAVGTNVGDLLRSISLETLDGGKVSPDDYRGKIVILNIWATWCPYCLEELPDFDEIASEYKDQVVIIAAHTPSGNVNAGSYVETNFPETDIIFAYDTVYSEAFLAVGGTKYVPRTAVIDENGVIIYAQDGLMTYERLVSIIEDQL